MGHRSNRLTKVLNVTAPDSSYPTKQLNQSLNSVKRTFFLESPVETYWRRILREGKVGAVYPGGSGALVYSLTTEQKTLRKVGFGLQKDRLQEQFDFMHDHSNLWNFPKVRNPALTNMYFSYDMDLIEDSIPFYSHLSSIQEPNYRKVEIEKLFNFIETGNSVHTSTSISKYSESMERLWDEKLRLVIHEVHSRVPQLNTGAHIYINGRNLKNLNNVFNSLRLLALSVEPTLIETNPHGDPTLSNLLINKEESKIFSIDPNPNQTVRNSTVDHGKVLQSLFLLYEDSLDIQIKPSISRNEIIYSRPSNHSIALSGEYYFKMLSKDELLAINSELMCFASMLRLLPYRLNQDSDFAPIFLAQAIEYGNSLIEKYVK
jgi:hypothetical protein